MSASDTRERFGALAEAVVAGERTAVEELERLVGVVARDGRPEEVAWLRLGVSRLLAHEAARPVAPALEALDTVLGSTQRQLRASRARRRREEARRTVKERVLEVLGGERPRRPTELAADCDVDIYQVSRALRELRSVELVEEAEPPEGGDGRAIWYRRAVDRHGHRSEHGPSVVRTSASESSFALHLRGAAERGAQVAVEVDGDRVWPTRRDEGADISPPQALERLARRWVHLTLEEGLPFDLEPEPLDRALTAFERSQEDEPKRQAEAHEEELAAFRDRHDLSRLLGADGAPGCWLVREGRTCWALTPERAHQLAIGDVVDELARFGAEVVAALERKGHRRANELAEAWEGRARRSRRERVEIATGLSSSELDELGDGRPTAEFWELDRPEDTNELLAAARMATGLPVPEIERLLDTVRSAGKATTPELDALGREAEDVVARHRGEPPHEQGYQLARWLRDRLEVDDAGRVDPEEWLRAWNVEVVEAATVRSIDAVACWGARHGPLVAVNPSGEHSKSKAGRRASLAHEIVHLLVDRPAALPAAEVLGGRTAPLAEKRARAFAAELLLPREEAGHAMVESSDAPRAVRRLRGRYGVSSEVVAWQARNSSFDVPPGTTSHLRSLVSRPRAF